MEAVGLWYDQLLAESLGKDGQGTTPLTVVNTRDLHSRGQQHQEGRRDKLITNLIVEQPDRPPLAIEKSPFDQDKLNELAGKTLPDILRAALQARTRPMPRTIGPPPTSACRGWTKPRSGRSSRCSCWPRPSRAG